MADQIIDKRTYGVPIDVEIIRETTQRYRDDALDAASRSASNAADAATGARDSALSAEDAERAAAESRDWATVRNRGVTLGPDEPGEKYDGMVWLKTARRELTPLYPSDTTFPSDATFPQDTGEWEETSRTIDAIRKWDASLPGQGLFPSDSAYPGAATFPQDEGAWTDYTINPALITGN